MILSHVVVMGLICLPLIVMFIGLGLVLNPFPTNDVIWRHETFSFMMSHPAMSLGDRLCASKKGGAGGGGWVHPKGCKQHGRVWAQPLVGAG